MLLGILSDTHDRYEMMAAAVRALRERGAVYFIHCGDLCEPNMLDNLAGLPSAFVWGNCDFDRTGLQRYGEAIGVHCYGAFGDLELAGKRIALLHGDDRTRLDQVIRAQSHDYLFHGHTHLRRDDRIRKTRVINPGALHRATEKTAALLDLEAEKLEYLKIVPPQDHAASLG
jgi:putative phosphoesterase